ncbi:1,2-phenylacetyl-CoA epoxidase subunit PaaD [Salinarimonas sp.]|uniref:1,2-phenylacetyl-CoA epoxidase subunit PaaD n=1 Tax=Salinarimonas sp. TaxID=2766526 RepID=UPI0032D8D208
MAETRAHDHGARPSEAQVWAWLDEVPDPEIPVISLVDLGIIRDVAWRDDALEVTVTPTYSGCPATSVINLDIVSALKAHGIEKIDLKRRISPAWTTDWISDKGREKLRGYGIAPPVPGTSACGIGALSKPEIACPHCGSTNTRLVSQFGSTPCKAAYVCDDCLEPFDYFKCI